MDSRPVNPKPSNQEISIMDEEGTPFIGYLDILIHHARDIQNICIYHKQDVYAKISLNNTGTESRTDSVSTRTVNGGGKNPVFNETLCLGVRALDASIRCEVWMLSRVKNYLQDQLLGLTIIPLSDLLIAPNNKLTGEFSLSSNDLFESPSGFVQLSLSYSGSSPDVIQIPPPLKNKEVNTNEVNGSGPVKAEMEKIEFPDLELVKENQIMVSEYFGIQCPEMENAPVPSSESLITTEESENPNSHEIGVRVVESFSTENSTDSGHGESFTHDTPLSSSVCTTDSPASEEKDKNTSEVTENEAEAESSETVNDKAKPVINIKMEQEQVVNQKDIMDMYMKSMQQFTDSLAKMKLPLDYENGTNKNNNNGNNNNNNNLSPVSNSSENGSSASSEKKDGSVKDKNSRVFYGSRAFF